jgi:hypothetical protein
MMANNPIDMNKIRHILDLHIKGRSRSFIASYAGTSRKTVRKYLDTFTRSGMSTDEINLLSDAELDAMFLRPVLPEPDAKMKALLECFPGVEKNLTLTGVTRESEWKKYHDNYPDGYGLSQFKKYFKQWKAQSSPSMHIEHKAGDKMFVDFAGQKPHIVDPKTGELRAVEIFISLLGASQLIYVEAVLTQQVQDLISVTRNALQYYGGVPTAIVSDNLKSAVTKSSKYEPRINENFAEFARYYNLCHFRHGHTSRRINH